MQTISSPTGKPVESPISKPEMNVGKIFLIEANNKRVIDNDGKNLYILERS